VCNLALWVSITSSLLRGLEGIIKKKRARPTLRAFILYLSPVFPDVIHVNIANASWFFVFCFFFSFALRKNKTPQNNTTESPKFIVFINNTSCFFHLQYVTNKKPLGFCSPLKNSHILDHFSPLFYYLRNKKRVPCFYRVIETRVDVCKNEKCCGNMSRRRAFPQLFRVLPNFYDCFYDSMVTRRTCFRFLLENTGTKKRKTTC